ncbi:MAG: hypothetical protein K9J79_03715 [Desulfobacteraceae bacterium]|nr:hypothetical protein [Desulfobacteraceae bacterium]
MNVLDLLQQCTLEKAPRKVSANKGGEYHSSCPGCGGEDRFHVWPEQNEGGGSYWCRQCEKAGDNIQFLIDFDGKSFKGACAALDRDPGEYRPEPMRPQQAKKPAGSNWAPRTYDAPADAWRDKAEKMVAWCHGQLLENKAQMDYLAGRGITYGTVVSARLGWNPKDMWRPRESWGLETILKDNGKKKRLWLPAGLVIPHLDDAGSADRIRIRRPAPENGPKYYVVPGSFAGPMILGDRGRDAWVIIESELDGLAVWKAAGDIVTVCALGSSSARPDTKTAEGLKSALCILDALDYDGAGAKEKKFWSEHFGAQMERWPVPKGKDPGDAYAAGVDLREWILAGLPPRWRVGRSRLESGPDFQAAGARENAAVVETAAADSAPGKSGPAETPGKTEKPEKADPGREKLPAGVVELAKAMKQTPVRLFVRWDRLAIEYPYNWASRNDDVLEKISELVYRDPEVFSFVNRLPAGRYTGKNLTNL